MKELPPQQAGLLYSRHHVGDPIAMKGSTTTQQSVAHRFHVIDDKQKETKNKGEDSNSP